MTATVIHGNRKYKTFEDRLKRRIEQCVHAARLRCVKLKKRSFLLSDARIAELITQTHCAKSGLPFSLATGEYRKNPFGPSIDRVDNAADYTDDNVQIVCTMFNTGKSDHREVDFLALCLAVADQHRGNVAAVARLGALRDARL